MTTWIFFLPLCDSIAGSWFQKKDIHRFSWTSTDVITQKEINLCGKQSTLLLQCRLGPLSCVGDTEEICPSPKQMLHTKSLTHFWWGNESKICCSCLSASKSLPIRSRRSVNEVQECSWLSCLSASKSLPIRSWIKEVCEQSTRMLLTQLSLSL